MSKIKKGSVVVFSKGEYSDYSCMGLFVALQDITEEDYQKAIAPEIAKERYSQSSEAVVSNLIREGLLLELDYTEIELTHCGDIDPAAFRRLAYKGE